MDSGDMDNGNDDVDLWPFKGKSKKKQNAPEQKPPETSSNNIVPVITGDVDSDEYSMRLPLGMCLIFNHYIFDKHRPREGTHYDAKRLYDQFRALGFDEVKVFNDFTVRKVMEELKKAAKADHSKNSCFICCILTHGDTGVLCARDGAYPISLLYDIFNGSDGASPNLRGIPKIFFIQACHGVETESGGDVIFKESMDTRIKIPTYADFLIMHSSFPGFVSFKNNMGSYFIQCLCDVLAAHAKNKHLMDMLTVVTRKIALYFISSNYKDASKDKKKQVPYTTSTLTKYVKFPS